MIVPAAVKRKFLNLNNFIKYVGREVRETLLAYCEEEGYAFVSRYKTEESLAEKIESGRYRRWSDLDDLYASTIVIPTLSSEPRVVDFLESRFKQVDLRRRGASQKSPDAFRYDATRFIGSLKGTPAVHRAPEIDGIRFEVQIRSAFEHAWSVATHELTYKSQEIDWRRLRLAAQLKAAVEQLDTLILAFDGSAALVMASQWPEVNQKQRIAETFKRLVQERQIPEELAPKDWSRFSENLQKVVRSGWAAERGSRRDYEGEINDALKAIEAELRSLGLGQVPRSVSLLQLALGILAQRGLLSRSFNNFTPSVTPELESLYPEVKKFTPVFDYEETRP